MNNWWRADKYVFVKHNSLLKNKFNQGWLVFSLHTCMALLSVAYSHLHFYFLFCFYSSTFICGMAIFFFNFLNSIKMVTFRGAATSPANQNGALPSWCPKEG